LPEAQGGTDGQGRRAAWLSTTSLRGNLERLRGRITGQPHSRNLDRWGLLVDHGDVLGLHLVLAGLDRGSIEMREVSPTSGLLPESERQAVLQIAADATQPA
jgi:hypothetical protein